MFGLRTVRNWIQVDDLCVVAGGTFYSNEINLTLVMVQKKADEREREENNLH